MSVVREQGQARELLDDMQHLHQAPATPGPPAYQGASALLQQFICKRWWWSRRETPSPTYPTMRKTLLCLIHPNSSTAKPHKSLPEHSSVENILYFEECSGTKFEICFMCTAMLKLF